MKVLLIDNYDSFTYNIVELLRQLHIDELSIIKNDEIEIEEARHFDKIILSPGPATPSEAGNMLDIIKALSPSKSILGICLGHQGIAMAFGGHLKNEIMPYHGYRTSLKLVKDHSIYKGLDSNIKVGLYHSWTVTEKDFPACLQITAYSTEGNIMSCKHKDFDVHGVQFHPESYMTEYGNEMLSNFLQIEGKFND